MTVGTIPRTRAAAFHDERPQTAILQPSGRVRKRFTNSGRSLSYRGNQEIQGAEKVPATKKGAGHQNWAKTGPKLGQVPRDREPA
jgi:hypothetical protein